MSANRENFHSDNMNKLLATSYFWPRTLNPEVLDYGYNCTSCHGILIGRIMYLRYKNELTTRFPKYVADYADEYFRPRGIEHSVWQEPVIIVKPFPIKDSTMLKGTAWVESRSKPTVLHRIRFSTLEERTASEERKRKAFSYMWFMDDCEVHDFQLYRTVPFVKRVRNERGEIIDKRIATDIPPPEVEMSICWHSWALFFYLIGEMGVESYGIDKHVDNIIRFNMKNILDKKLPFYELNRHLMEETFLLQGFKAWERKKL